MPDALSAAREKGGRTDHDDDDPALIVASGANGKGSATKEFAKEFEDEAT